MRIGVPFALQNYNILEKSRFIPRTMFYNIMLLDTEPKYITLLPGLIKTFEQLTVNYVNTFIFIMY